ncbi:MAG: menaquinone biosynthesis protein [Thermoleophilia bacterium]
MTPALRVGRISHLNMYPLYHHLARAHGEGMVFTDGVPTTLNAQVLDGRLDVSAMSSIEFARNADALRLLPVASISAGAARWTASRCSRACRSSGCARWRSLPHSATSVALLRVLAGPDVEFVLLTTPPRQALRLTDGVLLIGDEALAGLRTPFAPHHTDLGEMWATRTGLPMVFAVWAARRDVPEALAPRLDDLVRLLTEAQERYAADPGAVVAAAARRFPFPPDFIAAYFARLRYGFGPAERRGLTHFLELARETGQLARLPHLAAA